MSARSRLLDVCRLVAAAVLLLPAFPVRADLVFGTLRTSGNGYGFGSFDISNPTGSPGSYAYAWTTVLSNQSDLADLARDRTSGTMVLMEDPYGSGTLRSITAAGVMTTIGTPADTVYSLAFDNTTDELYSYNLAATDPWQQLNPATGATLAAGTLTGSQPYSAFGGNMTGAATGGFYFTNDFPAGELVKFTPTGANASTTIIGTMAGTSFDPTEASTPFVWGTTLHVLNQDRLYSVNESDASLTLLGTVTGLPGDFTRFTGAVAPVTAVPEPATLALAAAAGFGFAATRFRRRATR